ncbi:efflux RND transporter periplasmic adaptor subunit [Halosquirtibacter laminarini]|uniref:Efflux RND transporter periplasmic adaptor subunit n=1 Tax=Halosquirtibacter laminarini TaxID=3374600 RepID=A0AC61NJ80_9BACT|nr:efflux RND transporter periplasmic adaptor subunit [Prolixibacteraceae bacterium]
MKNRSYGIGIVVLIILIVLSIGASLLLKPKKVILQGEAEATEVKVATKLVGRIDSLEIHEGDEVSKGTLLLTLESPEVSAKMEQAQAAKKAAEAQSRKAQNGARKEQIRAAHNLYLKAKAAADLLNVTYDRVSNLYDDGVVPEQKRDEAKTRYDAAKLTEDAALSQYEMAKKGARYEDKQAAAALVERANGAVNEVASYMSEKRLIAPIDGEVTSIIAKRGELITPGYPVVTITDLSDVWFTFNVKEDLLHKFKKGVEIEVLLPAMQMKRVTVRVSFIKAEGAYATYRATQTMGGFDMKTFEVRATPVEKIPGLRPGMTALLDWNKI